MFGGQSIIDGDDRQIKKARDFCAIGIIGIQAADNESAAMVKHHDRASFALFAAVI